MLFYLCSTFICLFIYCVCVDPTPLHMLHKCSTTVLHILGVAGRSEVQYHPQLHREFKVNLRSTKSWLKKRKEGRKEEGKKGGTGGDRKPNMWFE